MAAVHCVIIGFTQDTKLKSRLFTYPDIKGSPTEVPVSVGINAYLLDAKNILVEKRSRPLSPVLPKVEYGSKPTDGGNFVITPEEHADILADEAAAKYMRRYVGSRELINGQQRWCLWLADLNPEDLRRSPILRSRIEAVRTFRAASKAASTRDYPHHHLFRQFGVVEDAPIVGIPEVSSENRRYLPVAHLEPGAIISNKVYGAVDASGLIFAIASSSAFMTWMKAVGGRRSAVGGRRSAVGGRRSHEV
uniref:type IIL restriction-modification enzyme MmeI n=1 Tax=Brachybacterium alimentarium TaxID=47845 RepID=UPI0015F0496C|nr:type IIL restriction-modification enzyme MmeI [Brachybacterium alimentarium]